MFRDGSYSANLKHMNETLWTDHHRTANTKPYPLMVTFWWMPLYESIYILSWKEKGKKKKKEKKESTILTRQIVMMKIATVTQFVKLSLDWSRTLQEIRKAAVCFYGWENLPFWVCEQMSIPYNFPRWVQHCTVSQFEVISGYRHLHHVGTNTNTFIFLMVQCKKLNTEDIYEQK